MADDSYMEKYNIVTDRNGYVQSNYSFSEKDKIETNFIFRAYQFLFRAGILRYFLYFLQADYKTSGIDFIYKWTIACRDNPEEYPISTWAFNNMLNKGKLNYTFEYQFITWGRDAKYFFENLDGFYGEVKKICLHEFGVELNASDADAIFIAQEAIMPKLGYNQPLTVSLPHDVIGYFKQINEIISLSELPENFQPLCTFPPSSLKIDKPGKKHGYGFMGLTAHKRQWEVDSPLKALGI
jgi:hypothetical protein